MNDVTLRPMSEAEFADWFARSLSGYAGDLAIAYGRAAADAQSDADAASASMLPDGRATADHHFLRVLAADTAVGWLWLGPNADGALWIYDIEIEVAARRRGYGRATMLAAEAFARSLGMRALGLNVFGHNPNARALYESLGYRAASVQMRKPLDG